MAVARLNALADDEAAFLLAGVEHPALRHLQHRVAPCQVQPAAAVHASVNTRRIPLLKSMTTRSPSCRTMAKLASSRRAGKSSVTTSPRVDSYMSTPSGNNSKRTILPARPVLVAAMACGISDAVNR